MTATNPAPSGKIPKPRQPERPLGDFSKKQGSLRHQPKTPCSPEKAGLLARLYTGRHKGHVVKKKNRKKIRRRRSTKKKLKGLREQLCQGNSQDPRLWLGSS
ncbi:hypothetical protein ACFS3C_22100 [Azotobacter vinelandii]